jgi:hypothetical protein
MSVLQWGKNPYEGSTAIRSPLLRFTITSNSNFSSTATDVPSKARKSRRLADFYNVSTSIPDYYVSMQFLAIQDFNYSLIFNYIATDSTRSNFSLPACTVYNGLSYVPCQSCNISSFTNYNVTYSCYDITTLCRSTDVNMRLSLSERNENSASSEDTASRLLASKGSSSGSSSAGSDGTSADSTVANTFGVLLDSIGAELSTILTSNPFAVNLSEATAILAFMGALVGFIVIMLLYFHKLDNAEYLQKTYVMIEQRALARKLLEEDMKNGGKGDLGPSFHKYVSKLKNRNDMAGKVKRLSVVMKDQLIFGSKSFKDESTAKVESTSQNKSRRESLHGATAIIRTDDSKNSFRRKSVARATYEDWTGNDRSSTKDGTFASSKSMTNLGREKKNNLIQIDSPENAMEDRLPERKKSLKPTSGKAKTAFSAFSGFFTPFEEKHFEQENSEDNSKEEELSDEIDHKDNKTDMNDDAKDHEGGQVEEKGRKINDDRIVVIITEFLSKVLVIFIA